MDLRVGDKVFAIVGGSAGMGFEAARLLAIEGAKIGLIGRSRDKTHRRAQDLVEATGGDIRPFSIADHETLPAAIDELVRDFGRLDGLAVTVGTLQTRRDLLQLSDEDWEAYFEDHVLTTVRACRSAIPHLVTNGGGTIVTISAYSIRSQKPVLIGYTTMKAAIAALTKNIALSYGSKGIRANCVAPGFIATEAAGHAMQAAAEKYGLPPMDALNRALSEDFKMDVALGRVGLVEEIAELIAFLLSDRGKYLSGALINCDGGTQF